MSWFRAFLTGRRQRVVLGSAVSEWRTVTSGVPQGSVLGPLLFVLYINDLPEAIASTIKPYADDSKAISSDDLESRNQLQDDLDLVSDWTKWLMVMGLNVEKCVVVHFGKNNVGQQYFIEDSAGLKIPLTSSECEKDLGVWVSSQLTWKKQVESMVSKANRVLGMLTRTFVCRDLSLWKSLYVSLVRPHLEYASTVWNSLSKNE